MVKLCNKCRFINGTRCEYWGQRIKTISLNSCSELFVCDVDNSVHYDTELDIRIVLDCTRFCAIYRMYFDDEMFNF